MKITPINYLAFGFIGLWVAWILGTAGWVVLTTIHAAIAVPGFVLPLVWWFVLASKPNKAATSHQTRKGRINDH